jgi:RNA polymerase sigma-B factor
MNHRPSSRDALIERNLPLARALAHRYRHGPEAMEDLIQVAALGLVKAADRWDPDRGFAFSSFAVPTILGELRRHFRDATWDVRPPRGLQERCLSIERATNRLARDGREPTIAELAEHLGWSVHDVAEGLQAIECRKLPSLDAPAGAVENGTMALGDTVGRDEAGYARAESQDAFERLIGGFDNRARTTLRLRFERDLRQWEIAPRIGCSQMQVSRIIGRSLEALSGFAAAGEA